MKEMVTKDDVALMLNELLLTTLCTCSQENTLYHEKNVGISEEMYFDIGA